MSKTMRASFPMLISLIAATTFFTLSHQTATANTTEPGPGALQIVGKEGQPPTFCPLKHTDVVADIAGIGAKVTVKQSFTNPSNTPIEAVYTFPLPANAAVNHMSLKIGDRVIEARIKRRDEARAIYDQARNAGKTAALLDQERDNVFTQSVANILPGALVDVEISFVEVLPFEDGEYQFIYPMVVGPRFLGNAPDPEKINPPFVKSKSRSGANISLTVNLNAGAEINGLKSDLHEVKIDRPDNKRAVIQLRNHNEIPNRDFILHYSLAQKGVQEAFLTHAEAGKGGYFTLVLNPPSVSDQVVVAPREIIFVIDQSGSQSGFPIEKSKELTKKLIRKLNPGDTFTVLGFSGTVNYLWEKPKPSSTANLAEADRFISQLEANGGTQLFTAVKASLDVPKDPTRLRLIAFNTDGFVGDESQILGSIEARSGEARFFTFGIGNSVNHFLIDAMSSYGRGDSETVTLAGNADEAVDRFVKRTQSPILTDIAVRFEGGGVTEVSPSRLPDVFSEKPLLITGRYSEAGPARALITGNLGGVPWSRTVVLQLPRADVSGDCVSPLWARSRIADLSAEKARAGFEGREQKVQIEQITNLGLDYGLMTEFTSLVAVEERIVNIGGRQVQVAVPVDLPDGVSENAVDKMTMGGRGGFAAGSQPMGLSAPTGAPGAPQMRASAKSAPTTLRFADENSASVLVQAPTDEVQLRAFLANPTDQMAAAYRASDQAGLLKAVAKLSAREQKQFWYLVKVDPALRFSKEAEIVVRLNVKKPALASLAKKLSGTGFDHPTRTGVSILIAAVKKGDLETLAGNEDILEIVPTGK